MADMQDLCQIAILRREAMAALRPPPKLDLADWVEANIVLPSSMAAHPGKMRLWPHQVEMARSMGDPSVERVSVLKAARVGYTQLAVAALGNHVSNDPCPVLVVLPAESDCRSLMVDSIEPVFAESPALRGSLSGDDRDTLFSRRFAGGSLSLVSARAPRNLRARTARVLLLDEIDGFEVDVRGEGDPVALATRRTATFSNRKIIAGSTPVHESTSRICRLYDQSDQRVYECPCPACGAFHELKWKDIRWETDQPETAHWACPDCGGVVEEGREKAAFVRAGRWRATRPEVVGHHGYRLSALISLLPNASWPKLAAEFLAARKSPHLLQTFTNTVLGEPWRDLDGDALDGGTLLSRREPFGLDRVPEDALLIVGGIDVQDDRIELSSVGFDKAGAAFVLAHEIVWGSPLKPDTWGEVDDLLKRTFTSPRGGVLRYDAVLIDSSDGDHTQAVYAFAKPRANRRVFACKGLSGFSRPLVHVSKTREVRLMLVGVDAAKNRILNCLQAGSGIRFSDTLDANYFEQLTSEARVVRYVRGQPVRAFVRKSGQRSEALDCLAYALAARQLLNFDLDRREVELSSAAMPAKKAPEVVYSSWLYPAGRPATQPGAG
ncbi:phage terminase large subunit family protein [Rhodomicrobium lacus]|uniref:phage terminase large subunit family protein n=1 Tax=Rhodomicrobium lacus TaxID=2498452 RepID=UPI0026E159D9|nr:phage terminase large subunit family protein [Rhodomicrobium lacus]WKW52029.1 phage terminase large subunit family protein [Rhodomicrobium lacus]